MEVPTREKVGKDRLPGFRELSESELWISDLSTYISQYSIVYPLLQVIQFHFMNQRDRKGDSGLSGLATLLAGTYSPTSLDLERGEITVAVSMPDF